MTSNSEPHQSPIAAYIEGFPAEIRTLLEAVRKTISETAPEAIESIGYGIPTYKLNGNLVHFAAFKQHIGFYPGPSGILQFETQLKTYKTSKGAVQFPFNQPIPHELIAEITRFRIAENEHLKTLKTNKK